MYIKVQAKSKINFTSKDFSPPTILDWTYGSRLLLEERSAALLLHGSPLLSLSLLLLTPLELGEGVEGKKNRMKALSLDSCRLLLSW